MLTKELTTATETAADYDSLIKKLVGKQSEINDEIAERNRQKLEISNQIAKASMERKYTLQRQTNQAELKRKQAFDTIRHDLMDQLNETAAKYVHLLKQIEQEALQTNSRCDRSGSSLQGDVNLPLSIRNTATNLFMCIESDDKRSIHVLPVNSPSRYGIDVKRLWTLGKSICEGKLHSEEVIAP